MHVVPAAIARCCIITTLAVGRIFEWRVHVRAIEGDDPAVIWGAGHDHSHP
jgi:hypothetical protein